MKKTSVVLAIAALCFPSAALSEEVSVLNHTGLPMTGLHAASPGGSWSPNILGGEDLEDGDSQGIAFSSARAGCDFSLLVVFDGRLRFKLGPFDGCSASEIEISYREGAAEGRALSGRPDRGPVRYAISATQGSLDP